ncbi:MULTISPECIES: hypothetical protein [unclassified Pseudoalteromonas]|uniref:hypothetical protein n=1 Tax=unclassified Pseudoalteromonas TaxID=194690 RepID=UPI00301433B1
MWSKTWLGFFVGLLLSISVVLNLNLLLPFSEASLLMLGLILAFPIWAAVLLWSYSHNSVKTACKPILAVLLPSVALNITLVLMA